MEGVYAFHFRSYDFSVSKDLRGFMVGDADERAIREFNMAVAAPYLATDEIVKVRKIINVADDGHQIRGGTGVGVLPTIGTVTRILRDWRGSSDA